MSNQTSTTIPSYWNRDDLEPRMAYVFARKLQRRLAQAHGLKAVQIANLSRMTGGASKETFAFSLHHAETATPERLVLRMDPAMGAVETCCKREGQLVGARAGLSHQDAVLAWIAMTCAIFCGQFAKLFEETL